MITKDLAPWGLRHKAEIPDQATHSSRRLAIEWTTQI